MATARDGRIVSVRPARADDAAAAVDVVRRSITESCAADHGGDAQTLERWLANKTVDRFIEWIANPENFAVVAEAGGRVAGVGLLRHNGEINLLYVDPGAQSSGIGAAIHLALEQQARASGLAKLTLGSTLLACRFYERLGYQSTGASQSVFGVLRAYPYEKTLD
jgi:GNAT superfamily N-acetyltransferase